MPVGSAGLVAHVLGVLLGAVGQLLAVLLGLLLAVSVAVEATSWATLVAVQRLLAGLLDLVLDLVGRRARLSSRPGRGTARPARNPRAADPMVSPSGFSSARPAVRLACCLTWPPLGVASLTRPAAPLATSPARDAVPATASLARAAVSLTLDFTLSIFSLTSPWLARARRPCSRRPRRSRSSRTGSALCPVGSHLGLGPFHVLLHRLDGLGGHRRGRRLDLGLALLPARTR